MGAGLVDEVEVEPSVAVDVIAPVGEVATCHPEIGKVLEGLLSEDDPVGVLGLNGVGKCAGLDEQRPGSVTAIQAYPREAGVLGVEMEGRDEHLFGSAPRLAAPSEPT